MKLGASRPLAVHRPRSGKDHPIGSCAAVDHEVAEPPGKSRIRVFGGVGSGLVHGLPGAGGRGEVHQSVRSLECACESWVIAGIAEPVLRVRAEPARGARRVNLRVQEVVDKERSRHAPRVLDEARSRRSRPRPSRRTRKVHPSCVAQAEAPDASSGQLDGERERDDRGDLPALPL